LTIASAAPSRLNKKRRNPLSIVYDNVRDL
jgi:hypothetical protein